MIMHPRTGQAARVHYAKQPAEHMPLHGRTGVVRIVTRGRGPRNVGVEIDGQMVVIPRGNLVAMPEKTSAAGTEVGSGGGM
ncbi:MAG: hypothetical protein GMKNLPBB_02904 [Myxococcota bacterium]|nr:hypothetical protein [Myxococcota bacterium]